MISFGGGTTMGAIGGGAGSAIAWFGTAAEAGGLASGASAPLQVAAALLIVGGALSFIPVVGFAPAEDPPAGPLTGGPGHRVVDDHDGATARRSVRWRS